MVSHHKCQSLAATNENTGISVWTIQFVPAERGVACPLSGSASLSMAGQSLFVGTPRPLKYVTDLDRKVDDGNSLNPVNDQGDFRCSTFREISLRTNNFPCLTGQAILSAQSGSHTSAGQGAWKSA